MPYRFNRAAGKGLDHPPPPKLPAGALLALALATAIPCAQSAPGGVFRWQDAQGRVHYGDRPTPGADRLPLVSDPVPMSALSGRVAKVYDGDTIELHNGDKVRLLGINTPEVTHYGSPAEAGAQEAKTWLERKLAGRAVRLESDVDPKDRYGRHLAHIFLADGTHINLALIREGLATTDIFPPNLKYVNELLGAEREAQRGGRGLWSMAAYQARPASEASADSGWQRLTGLVVAAETDSGQPRLMLKEGLEVRIPRKNLRLFPPLADYRGKRVELRGWVTRRKGKLSVTVRHPGALVRLD